MPGERILSLSELNEARLKQAGIFLDQQIRPSVINGEQLTQDSITTKLNDFQLINLEPGSDFKIEHIWVTALFRLSENVIVGIENCEVPDDIPVDWEVFNILNRLKVDKSAFKLLEDIHMSP